MATLPVSPITSSSPTGLQTLIRTALVSIFVMASAMTVPVRSADQDCSSRPRPGCFIQTNRDVAFIIDRSGSIALRGQTYNIEIEGVARALRDPTVIPRDGSTAIAVVLFDGDAVIRVASDESPNSKRLRGIDSEEQAEKIAAMVEELKCSAIGESTAEAPCPSGDTNFGAAISTASKYLKEHGRANARRMLFISTDGKPTDADGGQGVANEAHISGKVFELDVILIGLDPDGPVNPATGINEFQASKGNVARVVFPQPLDDLPGAVLKIDAGSCNQPGARFDDPDCARQVFEFVERTRDLLRSDVLPIEFIVKTNEDTLDGDELSLRQAIELANCRGGNAAITFDACLKGKTISPLTPLPSLTAPDITIDGICKCDGKSCLSPSVTIDGSRVDATEGEAHSDGILIRSNHDVVRGLKIVNFKRAGVAVDPVCPSDNVGSNRIELNVLDNNRMAGVLILDPTSSQGHLVAHNVGNTISSNSITGSDTPIDLGGDGSTPNDPEDFDSGSNTLLNFPIITSMPQTSTTVTIQASANQEIEIFKVTRLKTISGKRAIDAVEFIKKVHAESDGSFIATDLPVSPTGFYTATATDPSVSIFFHPNTSELTPIDDCTLPAIAKITMEDGKSFLEFDSAIARCKAKKKANFKTFLVENTGCAPLQLTLKSIQRTGSDVGGTIDPDNADDSGLFSVKIINADGTSSDFAKGQSITIRQGGENARKFSVTFHPLIPPVTAPPRTSKLAASEILPSTFTSALNIEYNGEGPRAIKLMARVDTAVQLINPDCGGSEPVNFTRSGDEFAVTFSVYDSDLNVNTVKYKFRDAGTNLVSVEPIDGDLGGPIKAHHIAVGQSFTVIQNLPSLRGHPNIVEVEVTVSDGEKAISASARLVRSMNQSLSSQTLRDTRSAVLVLPAVKLSPVPERSAQGRKNISGFKRRATRAKQAWFTARFTANNPRAASASRMLAKEKQR